MDGSVIFRTKNFDYPLSKDRKGSYKIRSGETLSVCMTSDFFLEEADKWRGKAWEIIHMRGDVIFFLLTKRPERVLNCLPDDWGDGYENVNFNVTCENQRRADERIPLLLSLPLKHRGIVCAPFIGEVSVDKYLKSGLIENVTCGGENYDGARPCNFDWVKKLRKECVSNNISFNFMETGTVFVKDGKTYRLPDKRIQSEMAFKSGMSFSGKPVHFRLYNEFGFEIPDYFLYKPTFSENCDKCASKPTCSGCSKCGRCGLKFQ